VSAWLVLGALALHAGGGITPEMIRARHAGARSLAADIVQTKEGRYWARPLVSHIRLRWTPARVEWEILDPVHSTVVIEGERLRVLTDKGSRDMGAVAGDPRFTALLRFLRALASFDLAALERDFSLSWGARDIVATPREGAGLGVLKLVRLEFDDAGEIRRIDVETAAETTRIEFRNVERVR